MSELMATPFFPALAVYDRREETVIAVFARPDGTVGNAPSRYFTLEIAAV